MHHFPASVSATHMASPSCPMQLYYGPTSHFALMQYIYRDLVSHPSTHPELPGGVQEAGAVLDLFSFRRIFFGTPDTNEKGKTSGSGDIQMMFLPYELAKLLMSRYLSSLYHMMPTRPKAYFENCLEQLYHQIHNDQPDSLTQAIILLNLATASLHTEYFAWGDVLYDRVKASLTPYDDVVNIQTIQISLLMISTSSPVTVHYADLKDTPTSRLNRAVQTQPSYIWDRHVARLFLLGFIKKSPMITFKQMKPLKNDESHSGLSISMRRRPSSLSIKDVAIEYAENPFIRLLVTLCKTISRSTDEIYGQRHESLLHMWRAARSIVEDLRGHEAHLQETLGFGLDANTQPGSLGVKQTIFMTLYYQTRLLTFRPFVIFRGHWQRSMRLSQPHAGISPSNRPAGIPSWLNEACNHSLTAAQKSIHHLSEASRSNDLVRELRYHGYFLASSSFTLIYDMLHDTTSAPTHLPWVYASIQCMSTMRVGDPIASTVSAIQTTLRSINPSFEWIAGPKPTSKYLEGPVEMTQHLEGEMDVANGFDLSEHALVGQQPDLPTSQWNFSQPEAPETGRSVGSSDDLLDFTQSDLGWNFDFSTMDLEAFFSAYQPDTAPAFP
ncbi:hypothetical protein N7495_010021 [Penicillium taxi]|uniref:uncharacterized protein n=1 Tax=Penicillium taxi TaxID=168475 RepID=UPI002545A7BA|nr:uncharacterized protein N7495_010021 [Penicillium taxi]KAJ5885511.1 hypothetical protein N7495_010021 [Penicillium taxi]